MSTAVESVHGEFQGVNSSRPEKTVTDLAPWRAQHTNHLPPCFPHPVSARDRIPALSEEEFSLFNGAIRVLPPGIYVVHG